MSIKLHLSIQFGFTCCSTLLQTRPLAAMGDCAFHLSPLTGVPLPTFPSNSSCNMSTLPPTGEAEDKKHIYENEAISNKINREPLPVLMTSHMKTKPIKMINWILNKT